MDERIEKWLYDVQHAIEEIDAYFDNNPKTYHHYSSNTILKRAIERNLEIIGETINRILKTDPEFPLTNAKRIV